MTTVSKHDDGMFSWTDLSTTDPKAAQKFYASLFGWTYADFPMGDGSVYTMAKLGERDAAAMSAQRADEKSMGVPPHWNAYITVADVDAASSRVSAAGGKVLMPPFDVMDQGRMSVIADPTGAVLCLWQAKKHVGAGVTGEHGAITWAECITSDAKVATEFYTKVMGWKAEPFDDGHYTVLKGGDKPAVGLMEMKEIPPNWLVYFSVKDCDAIVKKTTELGGKVFMPAKEAKGVGRFAVLADPQGAAFAVLQPAM